MVRSQTVILFPANESIATNAIALIPALLLKPFLADSEENGALEVAG